MFDVCTFCLSVIFQLEKKILHKGSQISAMQDSSGLTGYWLAVASLGLPRASVSSFICGARALERDDLCPLDGDHL